MFRPTSTEVALRQRELLREAQLRRLATVRQPEPRTPRTARVFGLRFAW